MDNKKETIVGYLRISKDSQDIEKQRHLLLEYSQQQKILIDSFIESIASSTKNAKERKIDEILKILKKGDCLIIAELSRLGRNMLETLNIIHELNENGIKIIFVRQPELSTSSSPHNSLLLAIYGYFAETEREYISIRTKQGLAAAREQGKILGRPKGSPNKKNRRLDPYKDQIRGYIETNKLSISSIHKLINPLLPDKISYTGFSYYVKNHVKKNGNK